jgi:hypothetical protein
MQLAQENNFPAFAFNGRPSARNIGLVESFRRNQRLATNRLNAKEIAVEMMLPANTIKNPHHRPKKETAPPLQGCLPAAERYYKLQITMDKKSRPQAPQLITRSCKTATITDNWKEARKRNRKRNRTRGRRQLARKSRDEHSAH